MKRARVVVPWKGGLHMRPAARLAEHARKFRSSIWLQAGGKVADARSILSILMLCASVGTALDVEVSGDDEEIALPAVESVFEPGDSNGEAKVESVRPL